MENNFKHVLQECNQTCKELSSLLEKENSQIKGRDIKSLEKNIKPKKQLTIKMEKFVNIIKENIDKITSDRETSKELNIFKALIKVYKKLLDKNTILLKAAYTATSTILTDIQNQTTVKGVKTYNAYGQIQKTPEYKPALINYSV